MSTILRKHMDALIAKGVEFQVGLRSSPTPLGPAKVERITDHDSAGDSSGAYAEGIYRILVLAQMQANKNARPQTVLMPVVFDAADLLVIIEAPLNKDGEKAIVPIGPNGRTEGGLVIPNA